MRTSNSDKKSMFDLYQIEPKVVQSIQVHSAALWEIFFFPWEENETEGKLCEPQIRIWMLIKKGKPSIRENNSIAVVIWAFTYFHQLADEQRKSHTWWGRLVVKKMAGNLGNEMIETKKCMENKERKRVNNSNLIVLLSEH